MQLFLYTYAAPENYDLSKRAGVFGTWKDDTGLATKVHRLAREDLIIIRNGRCRSLEFFGVGRVVGDIYDQHQFSPYRDLLWKDEVDSGKILYPIRVPVDFKQVPTVNLDRITWKNLDELDFYNAKGIHLKGTQSWAKKFAGNFLNSDREVARFFKLIELS